MSDIRNLLEVYGNMKDRTEMLEGERIGKLLWKLSLPAMIGMLVQASYNVVDAIFIGRGVGPLGLGGTAIVFPLQFFFMALALMIGVGSASLVSRSLGQKNPRRAELTLGNAISASLLTGLCIVILGYLSGRRLLLFFGATETILPYAKTYFDVILLGVPFSVMGMALNNVVRGEGNARVAMITMFISALLNIILDPIFIFVLHMGMRGAAIATVISHIARLCWLLHYFLSGKSMLRIHSGNLVLRRGILVEVLSVGASEFARLASGAVMVIIVNRALAHYGGDLSIAVYGIISRAMSFAALPIIGIAQGLLPIVGFSYGARLFDRGQRAIRLAAIIATAMSSTAFLLTLSFPEEIFSIFTTDNSLIMEGARALRLMNLAFFVIGFQIIGTATFQALGKGRPALILSLSRQVLLLLPMVLVLPKFLGTTGIWFSFPMADFSAATITLFMLLPQMRELRDSGKVLYQEDKV